MGRLESLGFRSSVTVNGCVKKLCTRVSLLLWALATTDPGNCLPIAALQWGIEILTMRSSCCDGVLYCPTWVEEPW